MAVSFSNLKDADLIIDEIYEGGSGNGKAAEVLSKLMPSCSNSGGFRITNRKDGSKKPAYVVLYTSMEEIEWPDDLDEETGVFRYYGDNRNPGENLLDARKKGNRLIESVFKSLNGDGDPRTDIPPFFVFKKVGKSHDVQFLGLAAPGNPNISPDSELVAFWRTKIDEKKDDKEKDDEKKDVKKGARRFQNYEACFTVLNTEKPIKKEWINALIYDHENSIQLAPEAWKKFINKGRDGIDALKAPKLLDPPSRKAQLTCDTEGEKCLKIINEHYKDNPYGFEVCAKDLLEKLDNHFQDFRLTRPRQDGGRDAIGYYVISSGSHVNFSLKLDCAMEAKCHAENDSVKLKEISRFISRIRHRQFGVLVTTSYVPERIYKEIMEDGHPILIISRCDIANILRKSGISSSNILDWLNSLDASDTRMPQKNST